jgi:high affinity sulfate transporter 1
MSTSTPNADSPLHWLLRYLPILQWLPRYQLSWLRADIVAGLTVWAVIVPEAMAYAGIAGVPALVGLYTIPIPLIAYAIFGTSRTMVIGPDSATALISAGTVGAVVASHSGATQIAEYVAITSALALIVGVLFLVLGLARMGWVANFIPAPVMKGFIQGLVWVTIIGQVPKLFGIGGEHGNFFEQLWAMAPEMAKLSPVTTAIGLGSLALLFLIKRFIPKLPAALTVTVLSIALVSIFNLGAQGVDIVGSVKPGLPALAMPKFTLEQLQLLIPGALAIVLLGYAESLGASKAASAKSGGSVDPNQELVSHGPANIGSAFSGGFIVVGSLSKTSVSMGAGGKTQMASLVNAAFVILTLMFLLPLFTNLPHAALAAIVIHAMIGLLDFGYLKNLWRQSRWELGIAMAAYLGVMIIGVLPGMGLGVVLSLLLLIYRATSPASAVLGRVPGESAFRDVSRRPNLETYPGLLVFRFDSSLFFASANHFSEALQARLAAATQPVRQVLVDAETINLLDTTGAEMLRELQTSLDKQSISLAFARVRDPVKDKMASTGVVDAVGADRFYDTVMEGVEAFENSSQETTK